MNWTPKIETVYNKDGELVYHEIQITPDSPKESLNPYRNHVIEEVALEIEKFKGFGQDTIDSFAMYIRGMKK